MKYHRSPLRYFTLGPVIILMAFTLTSMAMTIIQIIAGVFYISLGFVVVWDNRKEKP